MKLIVNGDDKTFAEEKLSVAALLKLQSVEYADMVSVQLNEGFVRRPDYDATFLKEGDTVNFLYFMGGGR
ncbi:MAG: sulfur carrier protein ThiS [Candidatus Accumulibacter sp.]|jgi:sulfur carrier protein|nr:sulfur carrier protein ThiS [Accumulibacter sp.]